MRKITCDASHRLAKKDKTAVYGRLIYLGNLDSEDNYIELANDEAEALQAELEEKALQGFEDALR